MTCVAFFICLIHTVMSFKTVEELNKLSKEELALRLIGNEMRDEVRSEVAILGAIKDINAKIDTKVGELNMKIDSKTSEMNLKIDNLTAKVFPLQFVYGGGLFVLGIALASLKDFVLSKISSLIKNKQ